MFTLANAAQEDLGSTLLVTELIIVAAVAIAVKWIKLPYTIALVTAGLGIGILRAQHFIDLEIVLTPELVFTIFLPVLLFEAAINLPFHHLKENLKPISLFAVFGVIGASLAVGYGMHLMFGIPLTSALVFGSLISATDPISVLALFKQLKAPSRLSIIVEGESLFNDGAAVVVFQILLALAITGEFSFVDGLVKFLFMSAGGLLFGVTVGYIISKITATIDDHLIEITLSTILAYGSYIGAEHLHVSGVMAVIAAGLVYGNFGKEIGMSPNTQVMMSGFWEYAGFLMNSLVFLLIGTQVDLRLLADDWRRIIAAFLCVVVARLCVIAVLGPIAGWWDRRISLAWHTVIVWAGLRGSISMALAIGLPSNLPWKNDILLITFGVVILSLFLQGLTMPTLLRKLGVIGSTSDELEHYETKLGHLLMHQRALQELRRMRANHSIAPDVYDELADPHKKSSEDLQQELIELGRQQTTIRQEQIRDAKKNIMTAQLTTLNDAHTRALISDDVKHKLVRALADEQIRVLEECDHTPSQMLASDPSLGTTDEASLERPSEPSESP